MSSKYNLKRVEFEFPRKMASLLPNEDRRAWSFFIWADDSGEIKDFDVVRSLINSKQQFSYSDVNGILRNGNEFYELHVLGGIARALHYNRLQNGKSNTSASHTIVMELMRLANYLAAECLGSNGIPLIHKLNLPPNQESQETRYRYDVVNSGHYALGGGVYTQFTSPIRRRLDRAIQVQLASLYDGKPPLGPDELWIIADHLNEKVKN